MGVVYVRFIKFKRVINMLNQKRWSMKRWGVIRDIHFLVALTVTNARRWRLSMKSLYRHNLRLFQG